MALLIPNGFSHSVGSAAALATALLAASNALGRDAQFIPIPGLSATPGSNASGCYVGAPDGYSTIRLSADGQVVTATAYQPGYYGNGAVPFLIVRWSEESGLEQITSACCYGNYGPVGISSDGSTIWGEFWRWTTSGGFQTLSSLLVGNYHVFGCTSDGRTVTGIRGSYGINELDIFRWTVGEGSPEILPRPAGNPEGYLYFNSISGDGSTIGGMAVGPDYTSSAVVLGSNGVINLTPTQGQSNLVKDLSDDGSVAVGMAFLPPFDVSGFRWTAEGGMEVIVPLGDARACNADGTIIGGGRLVLGSIDLAAWIRIGDQPWTDLRDYLVAEQGLGAVLEGWKLETVQDISADGRTIVGSGINPQGCDQGFLVRLDLPGGNDIADMNGDGVVDGADIGIMLTGWGGSGAADMNRDGVVDGVDLGIMLSRWTG
jgi:uncharacterized membrane protein